LRGGDTWVTGPRTNNVWSMAVGERKVVEVVLGRRCATAVGHRRKPCRRERSIACLAPIVFVLAPIVIVFAPTAAT
jgi:hypothetical protein